MEIINALVSAAFLILVAVSAAVTGSMILLGVFDYALGKKKRTEPAPGNPGEEARADEGNEDGALEDLHAEQMRKFGTR